MSKPRPTREDIAVDTIVDATGASWLVAEYRPTRAGFDLALGWPVGAGPGAPRAILTPDLIAYLDATPRLRDVDLPLGRTAIKRLRQEIGQRWDWDAWWAARADDLASLTLEQFCARHHCSMGAASQRRRRMDVAG